MAVVSSGQAQIGWPMPRFKLPDCFGNLVASDQYREALGLLVVFLCNHCPYVQHVANEISRFASESAASHIVTVGINSNDPTRYPEDDVLRMRDEVGRRGYTFPYLVDVGQTVAREFGAVCTPDFYLFDKNRLLYYRGQLDGSRPGNTEPVTGQDLRLATIGMLAGEPAPALQTPSMGCTIKWRRAQDDI
ncbi:thioredoxin family protein [Frankia sp. B2]|uniref:thioredoxin family protein n=1 Tax=unclassified Frankia TaxID=2632575 RepID=UPI000461EAE3|nr:MULTISPECIES: thioredoxin family protein [unclassified Frankia]KDA40407.1 Peroxiredoxin [Frankia sp. BMG5.23]TFE24461.1 thioredoxin family protein [Frankia sp. B2]